MRWLDRVRYDKPDVAKMVAEQMFDNAMISAGQYVLCARVVECVPRLFGMYYTYLRAYMYVRIYMPYGILQLFQISERLAR